MENQPVKNKGTNNLIWGAALIGLGVIFLLSQIIPGFEDIIAALIVAAFGVPFLVVYLNNRQHWWALIPAYVFFAIGVAVAMGVIGLPGELAASYVLMAIAAPFYYVYLRNRSQWWALIPAYTLTAITGIVLMSPWVRGELVGAYVMFAIALPFLYVYVRNREHWWALIPAGILGSIGVSLLVMGMAYLIPAAMIVVGIYLIVRQTRGRQPVQPSAQPVQTPKYGPAADKPVTGFTPIEIPGQGAGSEEIRYDR